ncbi:DNA primase [Methylomonas koyamae]|uniref:DNA primase n=1 Tax=Methylomonas koyamae TaxID=702114 RepID=A0A177NA50_9GAMM|nr:DNA primase [Methylomonas koyamae]OAI14762.1 DNA primase [Methylomonas koyamae]
MSGRIPRQFIDDLLVRVDIVDLIDSRVPLKKSGANYVARCPFHTEKTPSFSVNRARQIYHCFGCGASGNAIGFLMEFNHLGFVEAVEDLAAFAGVDVPREAGDGFNAPAVDKQSLVRLYRVLSDVAGFYAEQLRSSPEGRRAQEYLHKRGVGGDVAKSFQLGYAPGRWDALLGRFNREDLIEAGLLVAKDDGKVYDRFRGRLMFPIRDKRQRVVGFGGRVLDDSLPKYLNSPETPVFSKGKELYGLCELLQRNAKPARVLVVEGYMDVIALAQFGIDYAVAALGTATSKAQIDLLFRFTSELVFCFDGDNAGRQAAWKAVDASLPCLRDGRQIRIMLLPQGQDPDSLLRSEGVESFLERIGSAEVLSDYFFANIGARVDIATVEGRAQMLAVAKPALDKMPTGFFREMMFARLQALVALPGAVDVVEKRSRIKGGHKELVAGKAPRHLSLSRKVIALLVQHPGLADLVERQGVELEELDFAGVEMLKDVLRVVALEKPENSAILLEAYRGSSQEKTVKALAALELDVPAGGEEAEFGGALRQLCRQAKERMLNRLIDKEGREGLESEEKELLRKLLRDKL